MSLNVDTLQVPEPIKKELKDLSSQFRWESAADKGANGYLFFGSNIITNQKIAAKFYYWIGNSPHREPTTIAALKSKNIIEILMAKTVDKDFALFVTPFYSGGDLDDHLLLSRHSLRGSVRWIISLLNGLVDLHRGLFLHRDLKAANIFIASDNDLVIGDFGSVAKIESIDDEVPGSGHSLIYRPPELIEFDRYSKKGDIYQVGIVLYQLLGGYLPYPVKAWLSRAQQKKLETISDPFDRTSFADGIIHEKIKAGRVILPNTVYPWVPPSMLRIIRKATNVNPDSRYGCVTSFLNDLSRCLIELPDWTLQDGIIRAQNGSLRIEVMQSGNGYKVRKSRGEGRWQEDRALSGIYSREFFDSIKEKYLNL